MVTMRSGCFSAIISSEVSAEVVFSASMSSPASNSSRRTAESVTISSERMIGRRWRKTSFCTNFMCSLSGSFIWRKIAGTIFDPRTSWPWKVQPVRGS